MVKVDRAQFKIIETGEGFLKAKVTFAVPGVFPYVYADGIKLEAKLPDEILSKHTIDSARGAPVTDDHPQDGNGKYIMVDSTNYDIFAKGNISEPIVENGVGVALATIYDPVLIEEIKAKKKDSVSIGFKSDIDCTPGEYNGIKYDSVQRNITINHLACVDMGRSEMAYVKDETKIHIDRGIKMEDGKIAADAGTSTSDDSKKTYSYRKFDGTKDMAVSQELHSELMLLRKQIKTDADQMQALKDEITAIKPSIPDQVGEEEKAALLEKINLMQEEINAWKEKYAQLEEAVPEMADEIAEEKVEVMESAKGVDGLSIDGLSVKEIKLQIISKGLPFKDGIKIDSVSDDTINARYDAAIELLRKSENLSNDTSKKDDVKIDSTSIEEKRTNLKNMYRRK